ncbi:MAG: hypothetical protein AAF242_16095, partial [Bacteroidota bacterium]
TDSNIANDNVNDVFAAGDSVWVATASGLSFFEFDGFIIETPQNFIPVLIPGQVTSVYGMNIGSPSQTIFAGTPNGLSQSATGSNIFGPPMDVDNGGSSTDQRFINDIFISNGRIYVATNDGVSYSAAGANNWTRIKDGLSDDLVNSVFAAGDLIFAGTNEGMGVAFEGATAFSNYDSKTGIGYGPALAVRGVHAIESGGDYEIVIATIGGVSFGELKTMGTGETGNTLTIDPIDFDDAKCRYYMRASNNGCVAYSNIVELGFVPATPDTIRVTPASTCTDGDGEIVLRGLVPGQTYVLNHTSSNLATIPADGTEFIAGTPDSSLTISLVDTGMIMISVSAVDAPNCTSDTLEVTVDGPELPTFPFDASMPQMIQACAGTQLTIELDDLPDSLRYLWFIDAGLDTSASPRFTQGDFSPSPPPMSDDVEYYMVIRDSDTKCITEDTAFFNFTVGEKPSLVLVKTKQPAEFDSGDGTITLTGLDPNAMYELNYIAPDGTQFSASITTNGSGEYAMEDLDGGVYNNLYVVSDNGMGCESARQSCPLIPLNVPEPRDNFRDGPVFTVDTICGDMSGYFQTADPVVDCTGPNTHYDAVYPTVPDTNGIVVGRVRNPEALIPVDPTEPVVYTESDVEFKGYVIYDLFSMLPPEAYIDKIEYAAVSADDYDKKLCDVDLESATGDIQFDVTRLDSFNYGPYQLGFDQDAYDDIANQKYADFTIAGEQQGAWTDLGPQAVRDMQARLALDGKFQVGITLSGGDFDVPVYRFH